MNSGMIVWGKGKIIQNIPLVFTIGDTLTPHQRRQKNPIVEIPKETMKEQSTHNIYTVLWRVKQQQQLQQQ